MKVYRIWNKRTNRFVGSRTNREGYYTEFDSVKRALAQYKRWKSILVIKEFELTNEMEIETE